MSKLLYGGQYTVGLDQLGFVQANMKYQSKPQLVCKSQIR
jgi:hypothetical protein